MHMPAKGVYKITGILRKWNDFIYLFNWNSYKIWIEENNAFFRLGILPEGLESLVFLKKVMTNYVGREHFITKLSDQRFLECTTVPKNKNRYFWGISNPPRSSIMLNVWKGIRVLLLAFVIGSCDYLCFRTNDLSETKMVSEAEDSLEKQHDACDLHQQFSAISMNWLFASCLCWLKRKCLNDCNFFFCKYNVLFASITYSTLAFDM